MEMFSATDRVAASWNSWEMMAMPNSRASRDVRLAYSSPPTWIVPASAV